MLNKGERDRDAHTTFIINLLIAARCGLSQQGIIRSFSSSLGHTLPANLGIGRTLLPPLLSPFDHVVCPKTLVRTKWTSPLLQSNVGLPPNPKHSMYCTLDMSIFMGRASLTMWLNPINASGRSSCKDHMHSSAAVHNEGPNMLAIHSDKPTLWRGSGPLERLAISKAPKNQSGHQLVHEPSICFPILKAHGRAADRTDPIIIQDI